MLNIKAFNLGPLMTNCFLVWDESNTGYQFDIGGENTEQLESFIRSHNINLKYIILTHGHGDHILGLNKFAGAHPDATVYIGAEDKKFLTDPSLNISEYISSCAFSYEGDCVTVKEGDEVGPFKVIDSPGHTIGSKCYYNKDSGILISGDTIFKESYGRFDLPTGDMSQLFASLKKLCTKLPEDTKVFNGHTEETTIGEEKEFLKGMCVI